MYRHERRQFLALMTASAAGSLVGCGEAPRVLPQGPVEQQREDVRKLMQTVMSGLAAGEARRLIDEGVIFLPSRWRRQAQEFKELEALSETLKGREAELRLGEVHVAGRWALMDDIQLGDAQIGPSGVPWFLLYFSGTWRWLPSSIMKDPAVTGMMDSSFDRLWAEWQLRQRTASDRAT